MCVLAPFVCPLRPAPLFRLLGFSPFTSPSKPAVGIRAFFPLAPSPQVWALLEAGAITSAQVEDRFGRTCIHVAPTLALRSLLSAASPMHWAARNGLRYTINDLLKLPGIHSSDHPDDVRANFPCWPHPASALSLSLLRGAPAAAPPEELTGNLLPSGGLNAKQDGCRPLHFAAACGWYDIVADLLASNVDVDPLDKARRDALSM